MSAGIVALALSLPSLVPGLDFDREFTVDTSRIAAEVVPGWFEATGQDELSKALAELGPVSLRSNDQVRSLLGVIEGSSPWISRVQHAQKVYPDSLEVSLELRRPVAILHAREGRWMVDADGTVLALADSFPRMLQESRLVLLYREGQAPSFSAGQVLTDESLLAGLEVAADLQPHLARLRRKGIDLALVDVSPLAGRDPDRLTDINLYTSDGFFVQWGRSRPRADEPSVANKVRVLETAWERIPPFEDVIGICAQYPSVATYVTRTGSSLASLGGSVENSYR